MQGEQSDGGRGGGVTTRVYRFPTEQFLELRCEVTPGTHVLRLLLTPDESGVAAIRISDLGKTIAVQRVELLDADDGGVGRLVLFAVVDEVVVDLARAQDDALGFLRAGRIVDD